MALAEPGMFAYPNGGIPGELHPMPSGVEAALRTAGMIEESTCSQRKGRVFKITDKGRKWIANAAPLPK
jgi:hypothetical protein